MRFKNLVDHDLIQGFEAQVRKEQEATSVLLEYIEEIEHRRLYLKLGHANMFKYLTEGMGFTPASAQRRIDGARTLHAVPELATDISSGDLNLTQVAFLAQCERQKRKETGSPALTPEEKRGLLEKIKKHDIVETQKIIVKELDLTVQTKDRARHQKDESLRLEISLSKEQQAVIQRVREVISHTHPNPTWPELIEYLGEFLLKKKDPVRQKERMEKPCASKNVDRESALRGTKVSATLRRVIHKRDQGCQWKDPNTGAICGSRFFAQVDHKRPRWAGGGNEPENLQILCAIHNKEKYRKEAGLA